MAITLWDHIDAGLGGQLEATLRKWHIEEGIGTPTIARRLNEAGFHVEQRTVWRWLNQYNINRGGDTQ